MATEEQVRARREENVRLTQQIAEVRAAQGRELADANNDIALERANREGARLEAELAALMGVASSTEVSAPPAPDTTFADVPADVQMPSTPENPNPPANPPVTEPQRSGAATGTAQPGATTTNPAAAADVAATTTPATKTNR